MVRPPASVAFVLALALGATNHSSAAQVTRPTVQPTLTAELLDHSHVPPTLLSHAEVQATAIYRNAGVRLEWIGEATAGRFDIAVNVVPEPLTLKLVAIDALGATPGHATIAYVFYNPIQRFAQRHDMSVAVVLGHAIAHEIGHATLRSDRHAVTGLMTNRWSSRQAALASEGLLRFTDEESRAIRAAVARWSK